MKPETAAKRSEGQIAHTVINGTPAILDLLLLN